MQDHEIKIIRELKTNLFKSFSDLIQNCQVIWKLESPDLNLLKNSLSYCFLMIKESELHKKYIAQTILDLLNFSGIEKNKFISMFITSLEDKETTEKEVESFKESEYKARILSEMLSQDNQSLNELLSDLLEKMIITIHNKKGIESEFFKNCKALFQEFIKLQPGFSFKNLPLLKSLYASDSYIIRNSMTESIFYILNWLNNCFEEQV